MNTMIVLVGRNIKVNSGLLTYGSINIFSKVVTMMIFQGGNNNNIFMYYTAIHWSILT